MSDVSVVNATPETIDAGVVIQIAPDNRWAGSFWIVDEIRKWGVVAAYTTIPGQEGTAYIRLEWKQFAIVGPAPFRLGPTKIVDQEEAD